MRLFSILLLAGFILVYSPMGSSTWTYYHLLTGSKINHKKLLSFNYENLHERGDVIEGRFEPQNRGQHVIKLAFKKNTIFSGWAKNADDKYKFSGEIEVKIYEGDNLIVDKKINKLNRRYYQDGNMKYLKSQSLLYFYLPAKSFKLKEIKVVIKNNIADPVLSRNNKNIEIIASNSFDI